jgi:Tol biopolymer transport system component
MLSKGIQPDRVPVRWRRMAISMVAAAFVGTACGGGPTAAPSGGGPTAAPSGGGPTAAPSSAAATSAAAVTATTGATPSPSVSALPLPGGRIVYIALNQDGVGSLVTTNPDGSGTMPLLLAVAGPPRWSPDGRHISVVADDADDHLFVGLVDPDGSHYVQFDNPDPTLELGCFAWSPDGLRLACEGFDGTDDSRTGIYTVSSTDGGDLVRLTTAPDGVHDVPSDYSPDGQLIVFTRQRLADESDTTLMIMNADGSGARALSDRRLGAGRWSPDGKTILSDLGEEGENLLLVPVDGGEIRAIEIDSDTLKSAFVGSWSPDGGWIVFSGRASKSVDIYIVRVDGTNLHQVTDTPMGQWEELADWTAAAP